MHPDAIIAIAAGEGPQGADRGDLRRRDRLAAVEAPRLRARPVAGEILRARTRTPRASCWRATASSPGATRPRHATRPRSRIINRAIDWFEREDRAASRRSAARRVQPLAGGASAAPIAARLMPAIRGMISADEPQGRPFRRLSPRCWSSSTRSDCAQLAALGTTCPDHFLRTKIRPLVVDFDPAKPDVDADARRTAGAIEAYRDGLCRPITSAASMPDSPAMRDPNAVVYLVPGVGMITFARDKATARISGEFYVNAINVMRGASAVSTYVGLPEQEAFDIEYWLLEEAKLQRMPKPKSAGRPDRAGHRRRRRHRPGHRRAAACAKAPASCWPTSTRQRSTRRRHELRRPATARTSCAASSSTSPTRTRSSRAFAEAAVEFGGIDILVSNAGIASSAPIEETTLAMWNRNMDILATGYFLVAREAFRLMQAQKIGGAIVFVASKNGACRLAQRRRLLHGQGRGDPSRALPGAGRRAASASASTWSIRTRCCAARKSGPANGASSAPPPTR